MEVLTLDRLIDLAQAVGGTRISLFMPTRRFSPGSQEADATRLRNLVRTATERLAARGLRADMIDALLEPVRSLAEDRPFWLRSSDGLAVLAGPGGEMHTFQVHTPLTEGVWVSDRYYLRPLLGTLTTGRPFWLLALSQKRVRLLSGDGYGLAEVPVDGLPAGLADTLRWDDFEKSPLQFHTGTSGTGGRRPAVFHGTGETDVKDEIVRYFHSINRSVHDLLKDSDAPLVLAGVDYLLPLYRDVNTYPHLVPEAVVGNPDGLGDGVLHERAWEIVSAMLAEERRQMALRLEEQWASSRVTPDPETIVPAAHHGRIDLLLLADNVHWWGRTDAPSGEIVWHTHPNEGDDDLLGQAALATLANGGSVVPLGASEMPHGKEAVALLRY